MSAGGVHVMHPPRTMRYGRSMRGRYASYWNAFLFTLSDLNIDSNSDSNCKLNGYIVLCRTFSHGTESDSDANFNCELEEWDRNGHQNLNPDL